MIRTDEQIKKDVVDELYWDYRVDASEVKVEVENGQITLTGTVPTYTARNAATSDAWAIAGVKGVTNLLAILFPPTFDVPSDDEIKRRAEMRLAWNAEIYSVDIDISVIGGLVRLEGTVDAYWKHWKAEQLVADLKGVTGVENHLAIVPSESCVDQEIGQEIESAMERSTYIYAEDVTVSVDHGNVVLTGSVPTYYARERAFEIAANTVGVVNVENNIAAI